MEGRADRRRAAGFAENPLQSPSPGNDSLNSLPLSKSKRFLHRGVFPDRWPWLRGTRNQMTAPLEFTLPERISVTAENALLPFLRAHPDAAVEVSAAALRRLDTPLVQVLLAAAAGSAQLTGRPAAADRRNRGIPFCLTGLGAEHAAQLSVLGVTGALLETRGAA